MLLCVCESVCVYRAHLKDTRFVLHKESYSDKPWCVTMETCVGRSCSLWGLIVELSLNDEAFCFLNPIRCKQYRGTSLT